MATIKQSTAALIADIQSSSEFCQYQSLKKEIGKDPRLRERVDSYRRQCFFLQNKEYEEEDIRRIEQLRKDNRELLENALVSDFLAAEIRLCRMVSQTLEQITEAVDIGLDL